MLGGMGQVYWEKKRRRIVAQLAQPSKWDEDKYNGSMSYYEMLTKLQTEMK